MADLRVGVDAARRAADALLRGTGGRAVFLRLPVAADGTEVNEQLGLVGPAFSDLEMSPVVLRKGWSQLARDGVRWELMVSATAVSELLGQSGAADASALFADAAGVLVDTVLMRVESVAASEMGGVPYVYQVILRAPIAEAI